MTNYPDAPAIENIELPDYAQLRSTKYDLATTIIHYFRDKSLCVQLGLFIVTYYKSLEDKHQPFWNTDPPRLSFILKKIVDNKPDWVIDKSGIKTGEAIIDPLLNYIKTELKEDIQHNGKKNKIKNIEVDVLQLNLNNMKSAADIIKQIEDGYLKEDLLRFIAPHFYLTKQPKQIQLN
jgi:hypothetical protein